MGVISCRSREASLIPNYIRVKASAKCYSSNLGAKPGDGIRPSPGWEKSLIVVQIKQDDPTCIAGSRAAARESRTRLGKTDLPPTHHCARDTPTTASILLCSVYFTGVTALCDEVPR